MISLHPIFRFGALIVPLLVAVGLWLFIRRRRAVSGAFGDREMMVRIAGVDLGRTPWSRVMAVLLAAAAVGVAAADPRWGQPAASGEVRGGPVVLVMDVSSSMLARDVAPDRLVAARRAASRLVDGLRGRPIGIVAFAGRAFALTPPTTDPAALDLYLSTLDPAMVTQTGSSLSAAVRQGISLLLAGEEKGGAVVLLTDGDAIDSEDAAEIARLARRAAIPIFTGGVGTAAGAPIPDVDFATGEQVGFKKDRAGGTAISRQNSSLLALVARESGGAYEDVSTETGLRELATSVRDARTAGAGGERSAQPPRYAWFTATALLLLVAEAGMRRPARDGGR